MGIVAPRVYTRKHFSENSLNASSGSLLTAPRYTQVTSTGYNASRVGGAGVLVARGGWGATRGFCADSYERFPSSSLSFLQLSQLPSSQLSPLQRSTTEARLSAKGKPARTRQSSFFRASNSWLPLTSISPNGIPGPVTFMTLSTTSICTRFHRGASRRLAMPQLAIRPGSCR